MKQFDNDPHYELWWNIDDMFWAMSRARKKELSRYNLTTSEAAILFVLDVIGDGATPLQISRSMNFPPNYVSAILKKMHERGFINKTRDQKNKLLVRLTMTEEGREANLHSCKRESIHRIMSSALTEEEAHQLKVMIDKIYERSLQEIEHQENAIEAFHYSKRIHAGARRLQRLSQRF